MACVDWEFVRSVLSTRDITKDFAASVRKQIFFGVYAILLVTLVILVIQFPGVLLAYGEIGLLFVAIILVALEPVFLVLQALVLALIVPCTSIGNDHHRKSARHDDDEGDYYEQEAEPKHEVNRSVAVLIPCHRSEDDIVETVQSCLVHFQAKQIFVMDNSDYPEDSQSMQAALENAELHCVHYIFQPIGNKTLALYAGAIAAKDYEYLLLVDDDTRLPQDFCVDRAMFSSTVKAVCYPIQAVAPDVAPRYCNGSSSSMREPWITVRSRLLPRAHIPHADHYLTFSHSTTYGCRLVKHWSTRWATIASNSSLTFQPSCTHTEPLVCGNATL